MAAAPAESLPMSAASTPCSLPWPPSPASCSWCRIPSPTRLSLSLNLISQPLCSPPSPIPLLAAWCSSLPAVCCIGHLHLSIDGSQLRLTSSHGELAHGGSPCWTSALNLPLLASMVGRRPISSRHHLPLLQSAGAGTPLGACRRPLLSAHSSHGHLVEVPTTTSFPASCRSRASCTACSMKCPNLWSIIVIVSYAVGDKSP